MKLHSPEILGPLWGLSEFGLTLFKRAKSDSADKDRQSLRLIWAVNLAAIALGVVAAYQLPGCRVSFPGPALHVISGLFVFGLVLRWYAIIHLGRFFTVNVAIAKDHRVVDTGPYRFVRHPSYTGALLAVLAFTMTFENWAAELIIFVPCCAVTLWRIHVEEAALLGGLGEAYRNYMQRTKRLIPWIY
jgi:protein-S-isoprenylcysteine O-methyltransferase